MRAAVSLLVVLFLTTGCATTTAAPHASGEKLVVPPESAADPVRSLEQQVANVRSPRVTISTSVLRSLLASQRALRGECKSLGHQLDALKSVDLEEAQ